MQFPCKVKIVEKDMELSDAKEPKILSRNQDQLLMTNPVYIPIFPPPRLEVDLACMHIPFLLTPALPKPTTTLIQDVSCLRICFSPCSTTT